MRFIGGKTNLLNDIMEVVSAIPSCQSVIDVFSGSGAVSARLKDEGFSVIGNDLMYFSYVLNRGTLGAKERPTFKTLGIDDPISFLNNLRIEDTNIKLEDCFIFCNYTPNENCSRMYFQKDNAIKIDIIRLTIEQWKKNNRINEDEYFYLLAALIAAVPFVSNITGVYAAYLKHWG